MKSAVLLLLSGACLCAQQQGSLEGTAIHAVTRQPLSNVHVRLIAASFTGINAAYGAMSDRAGHFSIATIRPGTYILLPERSGFLHVQARTLTPIPTLTIKPGEHLTGYQLEMTPRAVLAGRVVDEAGGPVEGVRVQALPVSADIAPVVMSAAPNPPTDDRGEFRIIGLPGKYYLQATMNFQGVNERPEVRSDGTSEAVYGDTFYPSSLRKDRATVVEALAGKDVSGLEIRLARQQQGGLSISGVVTGIPEGATGRPFLLMQWGEKASMISNGRSTQAGRTESSNSSPCSPASIESRRNTTMARLPLPAGRWSGRSIIPRSPTCNSRWCRDWQWPARCALKAMPPEVRWRNVP